MPDDRSLHALIRFGLGRRGGEPLPADPEAWLAAQLDGPDPALALPGKATAQGLAMLRRDREGEVPLRRARPAFEEDTGIVMNNWLTTGHGFRERLVWFWANHFSVSLRADPEMMALAAPYLRDAIRPHVNGRFVDMLRAVMRHPAMLTSLGSEDPTEPNEALARVSLERHTVSPESGFTRQDVAGYAKALTGWSFDVRDPAPGFLFCPAFHQPGPKAVLGRAWPEGLQGGLDLLTWLGTHPATYRNLAFRLTRHFVADDPPEACVRRVETVLQYTGGDLRAAAMAVIALPEAWVPATKARSPIDYVVAVLRALDIADYPKGEYRAVLAALGQEPLAAPTPDGWADAADGWDMADMQARGADWIARLVPLGPPASPAVIAERALGGLAGAATMRHLSAAPTPTAALTALLTAPEFMRR